MENGPDNGEVARIFARIAAVMEIQGENTFKIRAYRNAVDTLNHLDEPVTLLARENRLDTVPGFGDAIQAKIRDIISTGTTPLYERLRDKVPAGVVDMLELPGLGAKTVKQLWETMQIDSVEALENAARAGRLTGIPGVGEKTVVKILEAIERGRRYANRVRIDEAIAISSGLAGALSHDGDISTIEVVGAIRRREDSINEVDIVAVAAAPQDAVDRFTTLPQAASILSQSDTEASIKLHSGLKAHLTIAEPQSFFPAYVRKTGTAAHWAELQKQAERLGLALTDAGLLCDGNSVPLDSEEQFYSELGLPWITPELRQGNGEIAAALSGALPRLIELLDIRGDVHAHTTASDGTASIAEMAQAARAFGYEYMAITDHSQSLVIAGGLTPDRLREHIRAIRDAQEAAGIRIYAGSEVDIKADGTLDYDDDLLKQLDIVIASAHMHNKQDRDAQTKRVIRAIENPYVDLVAHPTARLINRRDPFDIDIEAMVAAAVRTGTALEINAAPERLDLSAEHDRLAKDMGARIMIDTDAHSIANYHLMPYGINVARRAWLSAGDVLNTLPVSEFESWLFREKS